MAIQDIVNPLQNISYTNRDFESIYPELLDLVKQLTYKWDPSISNESDPGVILLKLNALIGDKCCYNIDKNILETFPLSVTQDKNARQLFDQLGYSMKWYQAATTNIALNWVGELGNTEYTIPAFTMVTDYDNEIIYSLVGPVNDLKNKFNVDSQKLNTNGQVVTFKAIQGIPVIYDINGDTTIKVSHLDDNNRIYFNDINVAQNGIFITNKGQHNYSSWVQKDNLYIEALNNTYYRFGVLEDKSTCYLEFPQDAEVLFQNGIEITYIKTDGVNGNISSKFIEKFYNDLIPSEDNQITLNQNNVKIENASSADDGMDPETINQAYINYKHTIGTFNTLVTLRDYFNAIITSGLVSNGFVCDRTNDIQSTYKIMAKINDLNQKVTQIESNEVTNDKALTAFSLKLYLLRYVKDVVNYESYNNTFDIASNNEYSIVKSYIADYKCISHDYSPIIQTSDKSSHFVYFKNKYPIVCDIITNYPLTQVEALEVKANIIKILYKNLNSKSVDFGEEISRDYLIKIITSADTRINHVNLGNINYTTYAVYLDELNNFKEVQINGDFEYTDIVSSNSDLHVICDEDGFYTLTDTGSSNIKLVYNNNQWNKQLNGDTIPLTDVEQSAITISGTPIEGDTIDISLSLAAKFRDEIYAKSVLAGYTQFFIKDEKFDYSLDQIYQNQYNNIKYAKSNVNINFYKNGSNTYTLRDNENVQIYSPNLVTQATYSNYVKFEYYIAQEHSILANTNYELDTNEYIIFYWQTGADSGYEYAIYGQGNIINSNINLVYKTVNTDIVGRNLISRLRNIGTASHPILVANSTDDGIIDQDTDEAVSTKLISSEFILSGKKQISVLKINEVSLSNAFKCYWCLNSKTLNKKFELFAEGQTTRILDTGEYFFYTDQYAVTLAILGAGTKLVRSDAKTSWQVNIVNVSDVLKNGIYALTDYWFNIPVGQSINLIENQIITLTEGCSLKIDNLPKDITISSDSTDFTGELADCSISYKNVDDKSFTSIPGIDIPGTFWSIRSILSINLAQDEEQVLLDNQSIVFYYTDDTTLDIVGDSVQVIQLDEGNDGEIVQKYYPVVIMSTLPIISSSGELVSTHTTDVNNRTIYASIYVYKKQLSVPEQGIIYTDDKKIAFTIPYVDGQVITKSVKFNLPAGEYIIPFSNSHDLSSLTISIDGQLLHTMWDNTTNFAAKRNYFLYVKLTDVPDNIHTLSVEVSGHSSNIVVSLNNCYKYNYASGYNTDRILNLITYFDNENHIFDYTYIVNSNKSLKDPCSAKSFLKPYHIFNPFMICQLDTSSYDELEILGVQE